MSGVVLEILIVSLLIMLNGVLAMSELAVVSARRARLSEWADKGRAGAQTALALAESPHRFLSTVQVGITLVGVLAGAFGGATVASAVAEALVEIEPLAPYADALSLALVVGAITYASLVIGELVPKRLALQSPERIAVLIAPTMHVLAVLAAPLVRLLTLSSNVVVRLLGVRPSQEPPVTEEEIRFLIEEGTEAGVFEEVEQDLVEHVFALDDRPVEAVMTPHTEIVWLDVDDTPAELRAKVAQSGHSRFPLADGSLDRLIGVVHAEALLVALLDSATFARMPNLRTLARPPRFVPENAPAARLVQVFKGGEEHLIVVIDEHGGVQGVVTEHDVLESIVGFLPSEGEPQDAEAVQRADGSWLLDGLMDIDAVRELLAIEGFPGEERGFRTLGGFVMSSLGTIPTTGACFHWGPLRFEVVDMDGRRVDKVLVMREADSAPSTDSEIVVAPCD